MEGGPPLSYETARQILSVSDITRQIRFSLETSFSGIWIEGEICNFKSHTSGHLYFSMKDESAQISCVMFRRENAVLPFKPEEGMKVLAFGRVSVYPMRGQYQLYVERMEPKGVGALQLRFEQLKEKLRAEGLFDESRKRPLPYLPSRIGIVTSIDGAALHDILNVLDRRFAGAHIRVYPVAVQGNAAALQIAGAIADFNEWQAADVLIIGRGGGSLEDLWAFNEEIVARAIAASDIPIISAVGHEVDFTISDFVADVRAATPSAAAEIVLPPQEDLIQRIDELKLRASQSVLGTIRYLSQPLKTFKKTLGSCLETNILFKKERLGSLIGKLDALGPLATLKRGFSATQQISTGKIVTAARVLKPGDKIRTIFAEGEAISQVQEIYAKKEK